MKMKEERHVPIRKINAPSRCYPALLNLQLRWKMLLTSLTSEPLMLEEGPSRLRRVLREDYFLQNKDFVDVRTNNRPERQKAVYQIFRR